MFHDRRALWYCPAYIPDLLHSFSLILCIAMENFQTLSIESFSYSWLVNIRPSFESLDDSFIDSLDASDEASFIEMDPNLGPSKRFFRVSQDFDFDCPKSQSAVTLVHADELISDGFVMPLFLKKLKMEASEASDSIPTTPISSHARKKFRCSSLRSCRRLSKQLFQKYLEFLRPLCQKLQRSGYRFEAVDKRMRQVKNWTSSPETSPRTSVADNWRRSCDSESSIHEAVLHCKRSIGK